MLTDNIHLEVRLDHLEGYVANLEAYTNTLHEEVHLLHNVLNPHEAPKAAEEEPVVIQVDSDTSEDEAVEPEILAPDEDGNGSGSDMNDD